MYKDETEKALRFASAHKKQLVNGLPLRQEELTAEEEKLRVLDEKLAKLQEQRDRAHSRVVSKQDEIEENQVDAEYLEDLMDKLKRPRKSFDVDDDEYPALRLGWIEEITRITRPTAFALSLQGAF